MLSQCTTYLANRLCGGSSRKLIAGWWYSILGMTATLTIMSFAVMGRRRPLAESFASFWSALLLCVLSVGGTMIMRKFHNSMAVGFFMGSVVSLSQMFFLLFLLYIGYGKDQAVHNMSAKEESLMAFFALVQSILLGSFAAILAAHRSEILDKPSSVVMEMMDELHGLPPQQQQNKQQLQAYDPQPPAPVSSYEAPSTSSQT